MKNKVFVTGATGFIGSHLMEYILNNHPEYEIIALARWRSPIDNIKHIMDKITIEYGDLTDYPSIERIIHKYSFEKVFHLAAQSYVPYSFDVPIATLETNVLGSCNLFEAIRNDNPNSLYVEKKDYLKIICITSSECYGQAKEDEIPIKETNPFRPASPYAVSKVAEDMLAFQYWLSWGMPIVRIRNYTTTGPRRGEVFVVSNFAKQIVEIEAGLKPPVIKVGNLDSLRTFADVRDMVHAYWLASEKCLPGEAYNIGGEATMKVGKMLDKLISMSTASDIKVEVDSERLRPSDVTNQLPSSEKFKKATGWKCRIPFEKTLKDTLDYWREQIMPSMIKVDGNRPGVTIKFEADDIK